MIVCGVIFLVGLLYLIWLFKEYKKSPIDEGALSFKDALALTELPIIVMYQGTESFNFLIDTGSTYSYINPKVLGRCKAKKTSDVASYVDCNGNMNHTTIYNSIFFVNEKAFEFDFNAAELSGIYDGLKEQFGVNVHGVIGSDFLNEFNYIIDFNKYIAYSKK